MYFFRFSLKDLSMKELEAIVKEESAAHGRAAVQLVVPVVSKAEYYMIFADATDASCFRKRLQDRQVRYSEPGDLPADIKGSFQYKTFLMFAGRG